MNSTHGSESCVVRKRVSPSMEKRLVALLATVAVCIGLTGCGGVAAFTRSNAPSSPSSPASPTSPSASSVAISTSSLPGATVGSAYSTTLAATGGTKPYAWSIASGQLPAGLTLSSTGTISGTPASTGTSSFTVKVSDSANPSQTASASLTLSVAASSGSAPATLAITTSSLPDGVVGTAYSTTLAATGGTKPYAWSIASGQLPAGLTLSSSGSISGSPTSAGSSSFTVNVSDSANPSQTVSASFTLNVTAQTALNTGPITSCGVLNQTSTTYVLQNDVSSTGTCFSIQASGITLDLNGHTVTYGACDNNNCVRGLGNVVGISRASGLVTVTLDASNTNQASSLVTIAGVADASFNGTFPVASIPSANTLTFNQPGSDASSSGGTAVSPLRRYGVLGQQCWDTDVDGNPCGGPFDHFTVQNGKIVQAAGATPYSHAIRVGQGGGDYLTVHDVDLTISANSAKAIYSLWAGGHTIYNNTVHDNVVQIINRHQLDGVAIKFEADNKSAPNLIYGNSIIGSPQGGIVTWAPSSKVYNNQIYLNSWYTNDFCVYVYGTGMEVFGNTCDNSQGTSAGRGMHITVSGASVHDNTIKVRELARNAEYNGCESGGAYGIQIEDQGGATTNNDVSSNTVTAIADQCDAAALRVTDTVSGETNLVHDNSFTAVRMNGTSKVAAGFTSAGATGGLTIQHNTFTTDGPLVSYVWDAASGIVWINNTIGIGPNPSNWALFQLANAIAATGNVMQDPVFVTGASDISTGIQLGTVSWAAAEEFFLNWTVTIQVTDANGNPLSGATVSIQDALGNAVFSGTTDASGMVAPVLTQYRRYNSTSAAQVTENHTPHTVTVSKSGFTSVTSTVTADSKKVVTIKLQ